MGRVYVVCEPCRRYVGVGAWLDRLDSRIVTFSCSTCGRPKKLTFDDPGKAGFQSDLRANPARHPEVAGRLQHIQQLANLFGSRTAVHREMPPQSERTKFFPEPRYRLRPTPFVTYGELPGLGLVLEVWCSTCKSSRAVAIGEWAGSRFGRLRFTCSVAEVRYFFDVWENGVLIPDTTGHVLANVDAVVAEAATGSQCSTVLTVPPLVSERVFARLPKLHQA
jgi:hypothetical protein